MKLELKRFAPAGAMEGELRLDGAFECWTLENLPDGQKPHRAIPAGKYRVAITNTPKFGCPMPLLLEVPGFEGVRIHPGNTTADTEGCILVGATRATVSIGQSRAAFDQLCAKLRIARAAGLIPLEITNGYEDLQDQGEAQGPTGAGGEVHTEAAGPAGGAHAAREALA
jgi:hypothetical protein